MLLMKILRLYRRARKFYRRRMKMRNQENQLQVNDMGLLLFALVTGWLLLFQSGLFQ